MPESAHAILLEFGKKLGYQLTDGGLCQGISVKWAEASLLGPKDAERFTKRIKTILDYAADQQALITEIKKVNQKVTHHEPLTERDLLLLEIPAMYEGITLHLIPREHRTIFEQSLGQGDIREISQVAASEAMQERGGLITIHEETGIYDIDKLTTYLEDLRTVIKKNKQNVTVLLSNRNHTMSLYYDVKSNAWTIMDINQWPPVVSTRNSGIADIILSGFEGTEGSEFTPMHTKVVVPEDLENITEKRMFSDLKKRHLAEMTLESAERIADSNLVLLAAYFGDVDTLLATKKINPNLQDSKGQTPLYMAAQEGRLDFVKALLEDDRIAPNLASFTGWITPLFMAAQEGHPDVVKALLASDEIDPNLASSTGGTPLLIAAQNGHLGVVKALLEDERIDPNLASPAGGTPLFIAAQNGHLGVVKALLEADGVDPNLASLARCTPLFIAAQNGHLDVIKALLDKGVSLNQPGPKGITLLTMAQRNGHRHIAEFIKRRTLLLGAERGIVEAFNDKPKEGIQMIKTLLVGVESIKVEEEIASFFIRQIKNLDLELVGDYLSTDDPENKHVLKVFTGQINLKQQSFVENLRTFLKAFKLPGEALKIKRLVQSFSEAYCEQNPGEASIDPINAVYTLASQVIMLNTSLHSPGVANKDKMDLEGFMWRLRKDGQSFDETFLQGIYDEIKAAPFELNFVKTPPGYEFTSSSLNQDSTFKELDALLQSKAKAQDIFPGIGADVKVTVDKAISWLNNLTGYRGTITLTDDKMNAAVTVQVYKPSFFSKWLFGEKPEVIIQPAEKKGGDPKATIDLAAKVAATFQSPVYSVKATYDYEKTDLEDAYNAAKAKVAFNDIKSQIAAGREQEIQQDKKDTDIKSPLGGDKGPGAS